MYRKIRGKKIHIFVVHFLCPCGCSARRATAANCSSGRSENIPVPRTPVYSAGSTDTTTTPINPGASASRYVRPQPIPFPACTNCRTRSPRAFHAHARQPWGPLHPYSYRRSLFDKLIALSTDHHPQHTAGPIFVQNSM
jgi:hypothetical protein